MRIRSIHPEFWRSEDVAALDWDTRLVFIGLWSYVDDNGVGRDVEKLICAELFPLEEDPRDTLATVSRGLQTLFTGGQITRYSVDGKPFLRICAWDKWQKIDRPGKARYPLPTCENAIPRDTLATVSRHPRETPSTGEGEKGRRGEDNSCASADAERDLDGFDEWWAAYPRKRSKGHAVKAYRTALRKADAKILLSAIKRQAPTLVAKGVEFAPYPATWLNGERWTDQPDSHIALVPNDPDQLPPVETSWMRRPMS